MILLKQMLIFFILMLIGYYAARKGKIDDHTSKNMSWIVINVANPALIISGSFGDSVIGVKEILSTSLLAFAIFLIIILVAQLLLPILRFPKEELGIYRVMLVFSNMGFMGFPIISAIYGTDALMSASIFLIPFNVFVYTYGIICVDKKSKLNLQTVLKKVLNIGIVACVISFSISILRIPIPDMIQNTITMLSHLTAPLSMMIIGASFIHVNLKKMLSSFRLLFYALLRLLIIPIAGMLVIQLVVSDPIIQGICLVVLAAPAASMSVMLAQQYDNQIELATEGVALTTILSVATMPILFMLFKL